MSVTLFYRDVILNILVVFVSKQVFVVFVSELTSADKSIRQDMASQSDRYSQEVTMPQNNTMNILFK